LVLIERCCLIADRKEQEDLPALAEVIVEIITIPQALALWRAVDEEVNNQQISAPAIAEA
jgi:hypothetical protein